MNLEAGNFRLFSPDENNSNRWQDVLEITNRCYTAEILPEDDHLAPDGRVMEVLSEHQCQGWLEGYLLTGRHGFFSCYEAFVHIVDSMFNQHAKWLKVCRHIPWRRPAQLSAQLARLEAGPQWIQPSGPGLHRPCCKQEGGNHPNLFAAGRKLSSERHRSLPAQPQLRKCDRGGETTCTCLANHGPGNPALRRRDRHLGMGQQ
jgi:D-xylulose 5-phosphate/D-fructose 6-phosphate phosphoketolase